MHERVDPPGALDHGLETTAGRLSAGKPEAGKTAVAERKKLPANALAIVQHLLTRMPAATQRTRKRR